MLASHEARQSPGAGRLERQAKYIVKNVTEQNSKPRRNSWIRSPATWLAAIATCVSLATFYLVHANPGEVKYILPDRIGLEVDKPGATVILILPVTFSNSGAPRTFQHVLRVTVQLAPGQKKEASQSDPLLSWKYELSFIHRLQYLTKYPNASDTGSTDYLDYIGQAFPFALAGGQSTTKIFEMRQIAGSVENRSINIVTIFVSVQTEKSQSTIRSVYQCRQGPTEESVSWCDFLEST